MKKTTVYFGLKWHRFPWFCVRGSTFLHTRRSFPQCSFWLRCRNSWVQRLTDSLDVTLSCDTRFVLIGLKKPPSFFHWKHRNQEKAQQLYTNYIVWCNAHHCVYIALYVYSVPWTYRSIDGFGLQNVQVAITGGHPRAQQKTIQHLMQRE